MQARQVLVFGCLALLLAVPCAFGQPTPLGGVFIEADHADLVPKISNRYRVYDAPDRLFLSLGLNNESNQAFTIRDEALAAGVSIVVSIRDQNVPVTVRWSKQEPSAESGISETRIVAGHAGKWSVSLARADGRSFEEGEYDVRLSLAGALGSVRDDTGQPWRGRFDGYEGRLVIHCALPAGDKANELAAASRQRGLIARRAGRDEEALREFEHALTIEPYDLASLGEVGRAYIRLKRYREAIGPLVRALGTIPTSVRSNATLLIHDLALAHVGAGDEKSAATVLEWSGRFDVPRTLEKLREEVRRKH